MPTLSKPRLIESESPWGLPSDRMYEELCLNGGQILTEVGFYADHDLASPGADSADNVTKDEEAVLRSIASGLTVALAASEAMPTGVLVATLEKVSKIPSLYFSGQLPAEVEWAIACDYQRSDEKPGTHWRDVWGDQLPGFEGEVEVPTEFNIVRGALSAIRSVQGTRKSGRPYNPANQILADRLGNIFRPSGQPIARHRQATMRHGKLVFIEAGPFYDFLNRVLPPLQRRLRERGLPPVTVDTIVRLVTEDFPPIRQGRPSPLPDFSHNSALEE
jgi:hypothetical protein